DPEVPLEAEDDVEQVDRLGPQVLEQGRVRRHVVFVHAEGINQGGLDFLENLVVRRHDILKGITDESGAVWFRAGIRRQPMLASLSTRGPSRWATRTAGFATCSAVRPRP